VGGRDTEAVPREGVCPCGRREAPGRVARMSVSRGRPQPAMPVRVGVHEDQIDLGEAQKADEA
jgi:hypothetical protein